MSLPDQEREDAMTIGRLKAENDHNRNNIETLFKKFDELSAEMQRLKVDVMDKMSSLSNRLGMIIGAATILAPFVYKIISKLM